MSDRDSKLGNSTCVDVDEGDLRIIRLDLTLFIPILSFLHFLRKRANANINLILYRQTTHMLFPFSLFRDFVWRILNDSLDEEFWEYLKLINTSSFRSSLPAYILLGWPFA